jgi:hypothetical protein
MFQADYTIPGFACYIGISVGRLLRALKQMEGRFTAPTALTETPTRLIQTSNNVTNESLANQSQLEICFRVFSVFQTM